MNDGCPLKVVTIAIKHCEIHKLYQWLLSEVRGLIKFGLFQDRLDRPHNIITRKMLEFESVLNIDVSCSIWFSDDLDAMYFKIMWDQ
jgi:hypothetical protein